MQGWFKKNWSSLLLLLLLILITYGNSLNNVFLSDDLADIVQNPSLGNFSNIAARPFGFSRPLLYFIAFHIGGLNPILFRSINLLLHIGSVFLIFTIFNFLFSEGKQSHGLYSKRLALIIASIFAVHPAIAEGVIWVSGGMYPQYTFFFLLSFLFYILSEARNSSSAYILSKERKKYYWFSLTSFLLACNSHPQMPLSLFLIFPLWELCFGNLKKNWAKSIPFFLIVLGYVILTLSALPERENTLQAVHYQEKGIDNIFMLIPIAISSYFELIFFPKTLTLYHSELNFGPINFAIRAILTVIFLTAILFSFKKNKQAFFWLSLFLIALSPTLTPFRLNWIVAERYLYLPILGIITTLVLLLDQFFPKKHSQKIITIFFILVIILLSIRTIARNIDWKNEDNLWIATGKTSPSSPNTHNNLGDVYGRRGDKQGALREFQTAISIKPNYADAYHNAANTYIELGQSDKALEYYQKALQFNPHLWQSYQNIAAIHFAFARQATASAQISTEQYNLALENIQKALTLNPKSINLNANLGVVYLAMGNQAKAKEIFTLILSIDPQNQIARAGLAEASK